MPAYYHIQLYKSSDELNPKSLVEHTVAGLIDAGCRYQGSRITQIEDSSLPQGQQKVRFSESSYDIDDAINLAVRDIAVWQTTEKDTKWLPTITIIFEYDFQFDDEVLAKIGVEKLCRVQQVKLDFWVRDDKFFDSKIVISLDTWEEYVLMYGSQKTHDHNLEQIIKIVENVCNRVTPHYGWLDGELDSYDASYESIDAPDWLIGNQHVVVGPQMAEKASIYQLEERPEFLKRLENNCVFLKRSFG